MCEDNIRTFGALLERKREIRLRASGYSMYPYIRPGDECRFVKLKEPIRIGQVGLVACQSGILYSHRLHRITASETGARFIFRGDANRFYDFSVTTEQVIGVLSDVKRQESILSEELRVRRLWSFISVRWTSLLLPIAVLGRLKRMSQPKTLKKGENDGI